MDRVELARVLKAARARVAPEDIGLPAGPRRRVAGLRREEVAHLAGVSVEYVVRLEQGRGPQPSEQVLTALARALRLGRDERDQLFRLAGSSPPLSGRIEMTVRANVQRLLDRLSDLPAMVMSAKGDVLAQNPVAQELFGDLMNGPRWSSNVIWQRFIGDGSLRVARRPEEDEATAQQLVGTLRTARSRYPDDPDLRALVEELLDGSERFWSMWEEGRSATARFMRKTVDHPSHGSLTLDCDTLLLPDTDQSMVVYSAPPGTPEADALDSLTARAGRRDDGDRSGLDGHPRPPAREGTRIG